MLSCEYYKIFKNTFFTKKPQGDCFCISICIIFNRSFDFLPPCWSSAKKCFIVCSEGVTGKVLSKKLFLKTSRYLQENTCKNIGIFLWILRNFLEHAFWRKSPNGYFYCKWSLVLFAFDKISLINISLGKKLFSFSLCFFRITMFLDV